MSILKRVFGALILGLLVGDGMAGTNSWSSIGTFSGAFLTVPDPTNPAVVYGGARNPSRLLKTTDGGSNWNPVLFSPDAHEFLAVAINPSSPSTVYAATDGLVNFGGALYKTTDGGSTWTLKNLGLTRAVVAVAIDPLNSSTIYAATRDGPYLFKSVDGGNSWTSMGNAPPLSSLIVDPATSGRLYAATASGVLKSSDGGATWSFRTVRAGITPRLAIDRLTPSRLYAGYSVPSEIYESTDSAETWTQLPGSFAEPPGPLVSTDVAQLLVIPGNPSTLFVSNFCRVFKSLDGGGIWTDASAGLPNNGPMSGCHFTPHQLANGVSNPNALFGGNGTAFFQYSHDASAMVPTCLLTAAPATIPQGGSSTLTAECTPQATSYVWSSNTGFSSTMSGGSVSPTQNTTYTVQGVNANGGGNVASATVFTASPRVVNLSSRSQVLTGHNQMIAGFIIQGTTPKTVVVRGRGPSLGAAGVANPLANPMLTLYSGGNAIASNDNWRSHDEVGIQATGFPPGHDLEAAIRITLSPGAYTAIVAGVGGGTGVGLVEVFEVDHPENPFANISTRALVGTGEDVLIGGLIVQGNGPVTVVIRARGPSMSNQVANTLANPVLQLFSGSTPVQSNDDWINGPDAAQIQAAGFAPSHSVESAILVTLQPGAYTAIVSGAGNTTGVGIVEVFRVP